MLNANVGLIFSQFYWEYFQIKRYFGGVAEDKQLPFVC